MMHNENEHEGQPEQYVSPWAPRPDRAGETSDSRSGSRDNSTDGEDTLPSYYASYYPPQPSSPGFDLPSPDRDAPTPDGESYDRERYDDREGYTAYSAYNGYGGYGAPPPPRSRRGGRLLIYLAVAAVAASIGAGATVAINQGAPASSAGVSAHNIPAQHNNAPGSGSRAGLNPVSVEHKVDPGLVDIVSTLKYNSETAEGTGMIVSSDGLVLTNNHVIDQSTSITAVRVDGGRNYSAKVLGYDSSGDIALLKLEGASHLPTVNLGNSDQLSVGTAVLALGNAQGRGGATAATGIISGLGRSIKASDQGSGGTENLHNMLQTSAQIQQGDSGGALANRAGQVVGMITAANTTSGAPGTTTGFAIPINTALTVARQVAAGTASSTVYIGTPGFLGVVLPQSGSPDPQQQASDEQQFLAQHGGPGGFGEPSGECIENNTQTAAPDRVAPARAGVLIVSTFCATAVNEAGLVPGDVITSVNGRAVTSPASLERLMNGYHPGNSVSVGWEDLRGARHLSPITLGAGPVR
ncbi:MAG TPA: trypsin-like peptidase domain-containing protein [Streptosporangiaceae bacterium]